MVPVNSVQICGKVVTVHTDKDITWAVLACSYRGGSAKNKEWKERNVLIKCDRMWDQSVKDKRMFVSGIIKPKFNDKWYMHIEALTSVVMD